MFGHAFFSFLFFSTPYSVLRIPFHGNDFTGTTKVGLDRDRLEKERDCPSISSITP